MPPLFQPCGRTLRGVESTSLTQPFPSHLGLSTRPSGTFLRLSFDDLCSFKELRKYYQISSVAQRILIHNLLTAKQRNTRHQTRQKGNKFNALSLFPFGFASIDRWDERRVVNKFVAWVSAKSASIATSAVLPDKKATHQRVGWPRMTVRAMLRPLLYSRASF